MMSLSKWRHVDKALVVAVGLAVGYLFFVASRLAFASEEQGTLGTAERVIALVPPEHRVWVVFGFLAFAAWALHVRFGKDRVAVKQRDAMSTLTDPLSADDKEELRMFLADRRRAQVIAEEMRAERRGRA